MHVARSSDAPERSVHRQLILDEIRLIVAEALASGETLQTRAHVDRLSKVYNGAGFSKGRLTNELISAAAAANVPVEIQRND